MTIRDIICRDSPRGLALYSDLYSDIDSDLDSDLGLAL